MNKYTQERKEKYLDELLEKIASRILPIEVDDASFYVNRCQMSGTIYLVNDDSNAALYCTPACDQYLCGEPFPEDHHRVDVSFDFSSEDGESLLEFKLPLVLNWHDVDADAANYFELVKAVLQKEINVFLEQAA